MHILLALCRASFEYVYKESSNFQMSDNAHNTPGGSGVPSGGHPPPPSQMTLVEIFMVTQTEVLRQLLR
jgi:hypothetical protein